MLKKLKHITSYLYPIVIEQCIGNISPYLEVTLVNGKYMLDTSKVNYSYGSLHKVFDQAFHNFNIKSREVKNVLILGFGAGSVASLLTEKYNIDCNLTGIEKDPIVIHLARKYFDLNRFKNLELICEDAYDYVQTHNKKFDVIVVDIYIDDQVPKCFHEKRFLKQLDRLLQDQGVLFFNKMVTTQKQKEEFDELAKNVEELFGKGLTYNLLIVGTTNNMLIHDRGTANMDHSIIMKQEIQFSNNKQFVPAFSFSRNNTNEQVKTSGNQKK